MSDENTVVDSDAAALAAMEQGVAAASENPDSPAPPPADIGKVEEPEKPEGEAEVTPEVIPDPAKAAAELDPAKKAELDAKTAIDTEVAALGLKASSEKRFRELAARPTQEALEQVRKELEPLKVCKDRFDVFDGIVKETGTTPEQLNTMFGITDAVNSGDPQKLAWAYDVLEKNLADVAAKIGKELPGKVDPLAAHRDLLEEVETGQLPRARALEIAHQRTMTTRSQEYGERTSAQQRQQQEQKQQYDNEVKVASERIIQLGARLKTSDPLFATKIDTLKPEIARIQTTLHPSQWASELELAYLRLPAPQVAAKPKPSVTAMPLRPTGAGSVARKLPKDDVEAFSMGIDALRG